MMDNSADSSVAGLRKRAVDHTNRDARVAIGPTIDLCQAWRTEIAQIGAKAGRPFFSDDHYRLLRRCDEIGAQIRGARTSLTIELVEAPIKVRSHTRIVDLEKALDNLEATLETVRGRLVRPRI